MMMMMMNTFIVQDKKEPGYRCVCNMQGVKP